MKSCPQLKIWKRKKTPNNHPKKPKVKYSIKDVLVVSYFILQCTFIGFGGGNALMPIINKYAVKKYEWIDEKEFDQIVITSNMLPGPSVIETLSYIAIKKLGPLMGVIVTFFAILPHVFFALGIYYGFSRLPSQYLLTVNVATLSVIVGILIAFSIRYLKQAQKILSQASLWGLLVFTFVFTFFIPSPFNISAIIMIGLMIVIFFHSWIKIRKEKKKQLQKPKNLDDLSKPEGKK